MAEKHALGSKGTRGPGPSLAGYEVVTRETTSPDWTTAIGVGNVTTVTLDIAKDNVQFGVRPWIRRATAARSPSRGS